MSCFDEIVNTLDLILCEDGLGIQFTEEMAPLALHVGGIVANRSEKEVLRVDASRVVASMQNRKAILNRTAVQFI